MVVNENEPLHGWLAGFIDGDGTVGMLIKQRPTDQYKVGFSMEPRMRIAQCRMAGYVDSDGVIAANIYESNSRVGYHINPLASLTQRKGTGIWWPVISYCEHWDINWRIETKERENSTVERFSVTGQSNVRRFLWPIVEVMVVKRQQTKIMLDSIIPRLEDGVHHEKEGFIEVMEFVDQMNRHKGGRRGKYNADYFRELWGIPE